MYYAQTLLTQTCPALLGPDFQALKYSMLGCADMNVWELYLSDLSRILVYFDATNWWKLCKLI